MTWEDRLREAAYTPPSGDRLVFQYENVSRKYSKRTTAFEFSGVDGAYIQDRGHGARRYPLRCYFSGPDHDVEAVRFEAGLLERGVGRLEHPLYGAIDVVPFGDITRRDDLVTAANQSVIQVTFWATLGTVYPQAQTDLRSEVLAALSDFDDASATQFDNATDLSTAVAKENAKATIKAHVTRISSALSAASRAVDEVNRDFRNLQSDLNKGLDVLIGQPLLLARQVTDLITAPARAVAGVESRLDAYGRLADSIFGSDAGSPSSSGGASETTSGRRTRSNDFHASDLVATSAVAGAVRSVVETTFRSKPDALAAAEDLADQFDAVNTWREDGFSAIEEIDTGRSYQALHHAVAVATGYLVEISFTLVPERRLVLDRPRTIIDLAAELYGGVDEYLDFLIQTNNLTGSEILELPRGREIVYYA